MLGALHPNKPVSPTPDPPHMCPAGQPLGTALPGHFAFQLGIQGLDFLWPAPHSGKDSAFTHPSISDSLCLIYTFEKGF